MHCIETRAPATAARRFAARCAVRLGQEFTSTRPAGVQIEVGLLLCEGELQRAGRDALGDAPNMAAGGVIELQHRAHELQNGRQMGGLTGVDRDVPAPGDIEEMAAQASDFRACLVIKRVIAAQIDPILP